VEQWLARLAAARALPRWGLLHPVPASSDVSVAQASAFALARDPILASISAWATARPEAPLTPGPGQVAAPISHTPGTTARWPPPWGGDGALGEGLHQRVVAGEVVAGSGVGACLGEVGGRGQVALQHQPGQAGGVQLRLGQDAVGEGLGGGGIPPVGAVACPGRVPAGV